MGGLFSKPKVQAAPKVTEVATPVVNQDVIDRNTQDILRRRKGAAATMTGASNLGSTAGSVAGSSLASRLGD